MTVPAGVCRFCGCSELDACVVEEDVFSFDWVGWVGCHWIDRTRTVCSACAPAAKAEAIALRTLAKAGYRSTGPRVCDNLDFVAAVHLGFVIGWFGVTPRSKYGRNPYGSHRRATAHILRQREAWNLGQRAGHEASRQYQRACGPLPNAPRRELLAVGRRRRGRHVG